ncbi:helicase-related protein, partial [Mycobacterium tuberculosis]
TSFGYHCGCLTVSSIGEWVSAFIVALSRFSCAGAFDAFRRGEVATLVVSKVANFSIDLPEAAVAVQVSGTFGSRQEEAQRLGRILRPKADGGGAIFYSVVARDSLDAEYAAHRQRFLAEQGYGYIIRDADDLLGPAI